jgi:23S rRNA pseudouridine1911/1915/1917 synthase
MHTKVAVPRTAKGQAIEKFLAKSVPGLSLERARLLLREGRVRIGGNACAPGRKLWGGEEIALELPPPKVPERLPAMGPNLPILFEDSALVVVDKPADLVVEPEGDAPSVVGLLAARVTGLDVGGLAVPGVAHRLDRHTTGCLALAKTDAALAAMDRAFDEKRVEKRYLALVLGTPTGGARLDTPYGRHPDDPRLFSTRWPSARRAVLEFELREKFREITLVEVRLETGRTHQIRVQLADAGFPVLGDPLYGPKLVRTHPLATRLGRQALHATRLSLPHPLTGEMLRFESPLARDLEQALAALRADRADPPAPRA